VTQAAIDSNIKDSTILYVETQESPKLALATFAAGRSEQSRFDLIFDSTREVTFSVKGKAEVHIVGYYSANNGLDDEYDFGSSDEDEDEENDELDGAPPAKKAKNGIKNKHLSTAKSGKTSTSTSRASSAAPATKGKGRKK